MKTRFKLLVSMFTLVLCTSLITFGAFAAKEVSTQVNGNVEFTHDVTHHVSATVSSTITGTNEDIQNTFKYDGTEANDTLREVHLGKLLFDASSNDGDQIVLVVEITNDQLIDGSDLLVRYSGITSVCENIVFEQKHEVLDTTDQLIVVSIDDSITLKPTQTLRLTFSWTLVNAGLDAKASLSGLYLGLERPY